VNGGDRFRKLERERPRSAEETLQPAASSRFGAVAQEATHAEQGSGISAGRFAPPVEVLELDRHQAGEQPFLRCIRCRVDSGRVATRCTACGASLETEEQRAFNATRWAEVQTASVHEHELQAAQQQVRNELADEEALVRRRYAEGLARDARIQALASLGTEGDADRSLSSSPGMALLNAISNPRVRHAVVGSILALSVMAIGLGSRMPRLRVGGIVVLLIVVVLFLLRSLWTRQVRPGWFTGWW
jgi:hypothetical protein